MLQEEAEDGRVPRYQGGARLETVGGARGMTVCVLHGHHNRLLSVYATRAEAEERVQDIRAGYKGPTQTPTRLRLIRILTDEEAQAPEVLAYAAYYAAVDAVAA